MFLKYLKWAARILQDLSLHIQRMKKIYGTVRKQWSSPRFRHGHVKAVDASFTAVQMSD